jgi:hypothetical protein
MEMTPADALDLFYTGVSAGTVKVLVVESWRLFADKAAKLVGSDMPTSRLIGAIEFTVSRFGTPRTKLVFQDPVIKKPTRNLADLRGYRMRSSTLDKSGGHASDAELHGLCWLDRHGYGWGDWSQEENY